MRVLCVQLHNNTLISCSTVFYKMPLQQQIHILLAVNVSTMQSSQVKLCRVWPGCVGTPDGLQLVILRAHQPVQERLGLMNLLYSRTTLQTQYTKLGKPKMYVIYLFKSGINIWWYTNYGYWYDHRYRLSGLLTRRCTWYLSRILHSPVDCMACTL